MFRKKAQKVYSARMGLGRLRSWLIAHNRLGWVAGCFLSILAGLLFCNTFFGQRLIYGSYDLPFSFRALASSRDVVVIRMDEASREKLGQPWGQPWDRNLHARSLIHAN